MKLPKKNESQPSRIDKVIDDLIVEMAGMMGGSEEYAKAAQSLRVLMEARALEPKPNTVSAETWATIGANLAGIVMILSFEKANVLTSKALSHIIRPKM